MMRARYSADERDKFRSMQNLLIGRDPMREGAHDWPAWTPATATLSPARPIRGWRMWAVFEVDHGGPRLCAPFLMANGQNHPAMPGVTWTPGTNRNSTARCRAARHGRHPLPDCTCGIRIMQSRTTLMAYAESNSWFMPLIAYAEVDVWGRTAPGDELDDWQYTLRAEFGRIAGPLHLAPTYAAYADALAEHYGVEVRVVPVHAFGDYIGTEAATTPRPQKGDQP